MTSGNAGLAGQYIPVATKEPAGLESYPGSDYYEIGLVEYYHQFHSALPPTLERGYVQLATAKVPGADASDVPDRREEGPADHQSGRVRRSLRSRRRSTSAP